MPYAYRKNERLRRNSDFQSVIKGKRLSIDGLSLFYRQNDIGNYRVGISISKKLAKAAGRNRLRRQMRDCIGRALGSRTEGYDLVFIARRELLGREFGRILQAVTRILQRSPVLGKGAEGSMQ
jgi:ribonuclease P protein component